jgi:transposase
MREEELKPETRGRPRTKVINRRQLLMRPINVEELVEGDHAVRAIWDLVGRLDLSRFYGEIEAVEGEAGRPALDPHLMISLWIYGYSQGVSSAREISRLCGYHPGYQWLTAMEPVNYHTLSDFRVRHQEGLRELFVQVLAVLSSEGLVTLQRVMHDGTKVKAWATGKSFRRKKRIEAHLRLARAQVKALEEVPEEEMMARVVKARQRAAREKQERLELALEELEKIRARKLGAEAKKEARVSESDPEARIMKQSDGGYAPSYNVQISTDAAAGIIVGLGVEQSATDQGQLVGAMERVEENVGELPKQVVVDGGFTTGDTILAMSEQRIDLIGTFVQNNEEFAGQFERRGIGAEFRPEFFIYDAAQDCYSCPVGKTLRYRGKSARSGRLRYLYRAEVADCRECCFREKCCPKAERGRGITRTELAPAVAAFKNKMETPAAKKIYRQRAQVAEFPNAWLKSKIGLRQFRLRGLIKVGIEGMWACLTYNIQQWIRLCWRLQHGFSGV